MGVIEFCYPDEVGGQLTAKLGARQLLAIFKCIGATSISTSKSPRNTTLN